MDVLLHRYPDHAPEACIDSQHTLHWQVRVLLGIFSFRFNRRISEPGMPGDVLVDVDHSGTGREGCNVSTLAITCEPRDWQTATQVHPISDAQANIAWLARHASSLILHLRGILSACRCPQAQHQLQSAYPMSPPGCKNPWH